MDAIEGDIVNSSVTSKRITEIEWFLAGLAFGGVATLLLVPSSGRQTRRHIVEKGLDGARATAETLIGEDRVERGRQLYRRGEEIRGIVEDSIGIAKRARQAARPLDDETSEIDNGQPSKEDPS